MNPTQDAWGKPKEKSNVKDKDGNEHPESSSANFKSHRGSGAVDDTQHWRRGRSPERKDRGGGTQRGATTLIGETENVKEDIYEEDMEVTQG